MPTSALPFLEIAARHYGDLQAYAHQLSRDYDAAEDALQHCLLTCAHAWPDDRPLNDDAVRKYIGRAIKNRLRPSRQRKHPPTSDISQLPPWEQPVAEPVCLTSPEARQQVERDRDDARMDLIRDVILEARKGLSKLESDCFELSLAGYNQKQIAELLGVSHVKAHRSLQRAKLWVTERFGERARKLLQAADEPEDPFDSPV